MILYDVTKNDNSWSNLKDDFRLGLTFYERRFCDSLGIESLSNWRIGLVMNKIGSGKRWNSWETRMHLRKCKRGTKFKTVVGLANVACVMALNYFRIPRWKIISAIVGAIASRKEGRRWHIVGANRYASSSVRFFVRRPRS